MTRGQPKSQLPGKLPVLGRCLVKFGDRFTHLFKQLTLFDSCFTQYFGSNAGILRCHAKLFGDFSGFFRSAPAFLS